jgi:SAM-dependent methyltransferase
MTEIDESFHSLDAWSAWSSANRSVYDASVGAAIAIRIKQAGFTEPMTRRIVTPDQIHAPDRNWREGLLANGLNSRMRAVLALLAQETGDRHPYGVRIFATEAITSFALILRGIFPRFLGSEYGHDEAVRRELFPIPHQDLTALTLPSDCFDIVTTNEVLEHVTDLDAALHQIARVLKPGGVHIGTHPFLLNQPQGDLRARLVNGEVIHLKEPEYHGNPVNPEGGSLVFETPGWDIIARARAAGFGTAQMRFVASEAHGYVTENTGVFVLIARK